MDESPTASKKSPLYRPSRLVEIAEYSLKLSLVLEESARADEPYATLSYRWEGDPPDSRHDPSQLIRERIPQWTQSGITESLLPRTYQDAIHVARKLDIHYIWNDAMCILKDEEQDFQQEAAQMSATYRGAALNIAGDGDRHSGLFRPRSRASLTPEMVECCGKDFGYYYSRRLQRSVAMEGQFYVLESDYRANALLQASCNTRGWVVQERLLSDCTLHFGHEQVFWESHDARCCELFPFGYPSRFARSNLATTTGDLSPYQDMLEQIRTKLWLRITSDEDTIEYQQSSSWRAIIELYSRTDVTMKRDRMIALSGLAQHWQKIAPEMTTYIAGLWYHDSQVPGCFLWRVKDGRTADGRPSTKQPETTAPTWSWLSVSGTVLAPRDPYRRPDSVRSVGVKLQDPANPFGLLIPNQSILEITGVVLRPPRLFWPPSTTDPSDAASDRSQITPTGIITLYTICSIDDITAFQQRFDASRSIAYKLLRALCLTLIRFSPVWSPLLTLGLCLQHKDHGWATKIGFGLFWATWAYVFALSIRLYLPRFWYREREEVCFLAIAQSYSNVDGLVLQLVKGDERRVYRRLGMFDGALDSRFDMKKKGGPIEETLRII